MTTTKHRSSKFVSRRMLLWHLLCAFLLIAIVTWPMTGDPPSDDGNFLPLNTIVYVMVQNTLAVLKIYAAGLVVAVWLIAPWLTRAIVRMMGKRTPRGGALC